MTTVEPKRVGIRSLPATIRTGRMLLRPWAAADATALEPLLMANVGHLTGWIPAHVSTPLPAAALAERLRGFADDFSAGRSYRYALLSLEDQRILGEADLFPRSVAGRVPLAEADRMEIGYWLDEAVTGKGLATEAARALLDAAFDVSGISHVEIRCDASNVSSAAVPRRLGFELVRVEGTLQVWCTPSPRAPITLATVKKLK